MSEAPGQPQQPAAENSAAERLESWKEIASYLKKDVRTVQRWEKREALPVYRHMHAERGTVYAYRRELEAWWNNRRPRLEAEEVRAQQRTLSMTQAGLLAALLVLLTMVVTWHWNKRNSEPVHPAVVASLEVPPNPEDLVFTATPRILPPSPLYSGNLWVPLAAEGDSFKPRIAAGSVYDAQSSRLILIGGLSETFLNDVWLLENADGAGGRPRWRKLRIRGPAPLPRMGHSLIYDPRSNRLLLFGGRDATLWFNDVWVLANANGRGGNPRWEELRPASELPPPRAGHSAVYNANANRMIICGGSSAAPGSFYSDVWVLEDFTHPHGKPRWSRLNIVGPGPGGLNAHSAVFDAVSGRMIVMGGHPYPPDAADASPEVWLLEISKEDAAGRWIHLPVRGPKPPPRSEHIALYLPDRNEMIVGFGSSHVAHSSDNLADLWVLSGANGLDGDAGWRELTVPDPRPGPRSLAHSAFAGPDGRFILVGGHVGSGRLPLRDLWAFEAPEQVPVEISESFDSAELSPAWLPLAKSTGVSLRENPGHLRYRVAARPAKGLPGGVSRGFRGEHWVLEAKVSYFMGTSGGGRSLLTDILFGAVRPPQGTNRDNLLIIARERGDWAGRDAGTLSVQFVEGGREGLKSSVVLNPQDSYVWRVRRDGLLVTVEASDDGAEFREVARHRFGPQIQNVIQFVAVTGQSFASFDSFVDVDHIRVTKNPPPVPLSAIR